MHRLTLGLALLLALAGCGETRQIPRKETLSLDQVPPAAMEAARKALPGVKFQQAWKRNGNIYEVSGTAADGKVREVDVKEDGTVVEVE